MVTNVGYEDLVLDPFAFKRLCWPEVRFYDKQAEIIQSVIRDDETVVPAGNKLGKDFIGGFIIPWFFLSRNPCRIVTTSVDASHLDVLWGEIKRFISSSRLPLDSSKGGPLLVNHMHIRKIVNGEIDSLSYIIGRVAAKGEGLQGHHIAKAVDGLPRTMLVIDEASGVEEEAYKMGDTWAHRKLIIGNPWPCENFFKHAVKGKPGTEDRGGDLPRVDREGYYRKIIKIRAEDSPNIRFALGQQARGIKPTGTILVPGVKDIDEYTKNRLMWDEVQQCVSLDAEFYEGGDVLMFPPLWLNRAEEIADELDRSGVARHAKSLAIDAAEGGDDTCWTWADHYGIIDQFSMKTKDTNDIPGRTIEIGRRLSIDPGSWIFDRGGGGKQHADRLRAQGYPVRVVQFGLAATVPAVAARIHQSNYRPSTTKMLEDENRQVYKNRRAEMYGLLRGLINPTANPKGFALPRKLTDLRRQLALIPLTYDEEGVLYVIPKGSRFESKTKGAQTKPTLFKVLGRSPDQADSAVMAVYCMLKTAANAVAGAV